MQRPRPTPQICSWKERTKFIQHVTLTQATPINHGSTPRVAMTIRRCAIKCYTSCPTTKRNEVRVDGSEIRDQRISWGYASFSHDLQGGVLHPISVLGCLGFLNHQQVDAIRGGTKTISKKNKENNNQPVQNAGILGQKSLGFKSLTVLVLVPENKPKRKGIKLHI